LLFFILLVLPVMLLWYSSHDLVELKSLKKFILLTNEIRTKEKLQAYYHLIYYLRRVIFMAICFFL
jgi:hypothetical protein